MTKIKPTPEQIKKFNLVLKETARAGVFKQFNLNNTCISRYYSRGNLTDNQYLAAEEYYKCWYFGTKPKRIISTLSERIGGNDTLITISDYQVDNKIKYENAREHIRKDFRDFVDNVVCYDYTARDSIKKMLKNPNNNETYNINSAFDLLKVNLNDLAEHFRYKLFD